MRSLTLLLLAASAISGALAASEGAVVDGALGSSLPPTYDCDSCLWGIGMLYQVGNDPMGKDIILYVLNLICGALPPAIPAEECYKFLDAEYDLLVKWAESTFPAETACSIIGVCEYAVDPSLQVDCETCKFGISLLADFVQLGSVENIILRVADTLCRNMLFVLGSICGDILTGVISDIIANIDTGYPPADTCKMIGVCH